MKKQRARTEKKAEPVGVERTRDLDLTITAPVGAVRRGEGGSGLLAHVDKCVHYSDFES